jgi:iron(III) transport system substrate-binding protein
MNRFWVAALLLVARASIASAADDKTIEAARKEGALSFYTTMAAGESKLFADAFQSKYPFIKVEITRLGSDKLLQRIFTESRAGRGLFDATSNSGFEMHLLNKARLLARYPSPEFNAFVADSKDKDGYWVDMYSNVRVLAYNSRLVPKEKRPVATRIFSTPSGRAPSAFPKRSTLGTAPCCA